MAHSSNSPLLIAFYLPQFHPIAENNRWWGNGFTEWTNVVQAKPLFPGHYQPHLPADLGFYDLRLAEVRQAQADLARENGIYGFCYYHYWFQGRRLLEQPFDEVLTSGEPDFPFCLCWANETWTRAWDGKSGKHLMEQKYSEEDDRLHIRWMKKVFQDDRYIRIGNKPLFLVYRALSIPDPLRTTAIWREEAYKMGIGDIFLCRVESFKNERDDPNNYASVVQNMLEKPDPPFKRFPCVTPSWDNSPRRKTDAVIIHGSTPRSYGRWLNGVIKKSVRKNTENNFIFINAWNEWGESNHLEPCQKWGTAYLEATKRALTNPASN